MLHHKHLKQQHSQNPQHFDILKLPEHLIFKILSLLPIKTIFRCRSVCKSFSRIVTTNYFKRLHLSTSPTSFVLRFGKNLCNIIDIDDSPISCYLDSARANGDIPRSYGNYSFCCHEFEGVRGLNLVNSVNGLVCVCVDNGPEVASVYVVFNPVLLECVVLPEVGELGGKSVYLGYSGFGVDGDGRYKVVRFEICEGEVVIRVHELGSGGGSWGCVKGVKAPSGWSLFDPFINGGIHWVGVDGLVYAFDVGEETVREVPYPVDFYDNEYWNRVSYLNVGKLGDDLCVCYVLEATRFEVWVMSDYCVMESWTQKFSIDMTLYCGLYLGVNSWPIGFLNNGDMWFISASRFVNSYCPEKRSIKDLNISGRRDNGLDAVPYTPSFISLKDVFRSEHGGEIYKGKTTDFGAPKDILTFARYMLGFHF